MGKSRDDFVGGWNQVRGMRRIGFWVENEEPAGALANPLNQAPVIGAAQQGLDAVERIGAAAAGRHIRGFGPFVNHGKRKAEIGGHLLGAAFLKDLAQYLM